MSSADFARVSTFVAVAPARAFEIFTAEIDRWWRRAPRFGLSGDAAAVLRFEGGAGGRLIELCGDGRKQEIGRVLRWEPGTRLCFEWRPGGFGPEERTEVDISFEAREGGTQVVLEHRGWDTVRADHPIRKTLNGEAFTAMLGLFWAELWTGLRAYAARP